MHVKQNKGSVTEHLFIAVFLFIYLIYYSSVSDGIYWIGPAEARPLQWV